MQPWGPDREGFTSKESAEAPTGYLAKAWVDERS